MSNSYNNEELMQHETTILDEIMTMLESNGDVPREVKDRLLLKAMAEMLRKIDAVESISLVMLFKRKPVQFIIGLTAGFLLLHEFSTYINFAAFFAVAAKMFGIPVD